MILQNEKEVWVLDETNGIFNGPNELSIEGELTLISEISGMLVEKILSEGKCSLPLISESCNMHRTLIEAFLSHWNVFHQSNE